MQIKAITAALLLVATSMSVFSANPKREMRSTWLTTVENIDWPSVGVLAIQFSKYRKTSCV